MTCEVIEVKDDGNRLIRFPLTAGTNFFTELDKIGQMPLPPYIKEKLKDKERYQTVYSKEEGSAAAPTAGLHFTPELLDAPAPKGVKVVFVTLHGLGTFRPVSVDNILDHKMHSEHYHMPKETADAINDTKKNGGRVIAVGTTSCRTIESVAKKCGKICEDDDWTDIFIYRALNSRALMRSSRISTCPESTLIMMVCRACRPMEHILNAYNTLRQALPLLPSATPCSSNNFERNFFTCTFIKREPRAARRAPNRARHGADTGVYERRDGCSD